MRYKIKFRRNYKYLYKIVAFLLLFLTIFILPFSLIIQRKAETEMSNNIKKANEKVLQQIFHDY